MPGCRFIGCSRYVHGHMLQHQQENPGHAHPIVFSFADFSYWCYACDSYVEHPLLNQARYFHAQKFPVEISQKEMLKKIKDAKYKEELKEEENEDDEEHES